jgi:glyoxylase-like metal-dependent hydrolase (beta-lactamase superfamily II)
LIHRNTGAIENGFYVLGTAEVPVYLLDGPKPILFDAGVTCLSDLYIQDAKQVLGGRQPEMLFLTHMHFDHCGAVSELKSAFPNLTVAASRRAAEIAGRPNAIKLIGKLNDGVVALAKAIGYEGARRIPFEPFEVDVILADDQVIALGGKQTIQAVPSPGHTRDFLSYYVQDKKLLIPSENVGCASGDGKVFAEFLTDYYAYLDTVNRLGQWEVKILAAGHYSVYTGRGEIRRVFEKTLKAAEDLKQLVDRLLESEGSDIERILRMVKATEYDPVAEPKQGEPGYILNTRTRIAHLAELKGLGKTL